VKELIPANMDLGIDADANACVNLDDLGSKRSLEENKKLDSLRPDPNNPGKNQKAIDYVIGLEIQKTIAVFDEYINYFDCITQHDPERV